ncbi:3-hydroxyisobutyrate dehydrogenase [Lineolata rhizophorae]|uniref:3-hydroxyisobutyrate dehydrogenase n=1 Tax=Lineolata rhizophorae TaxID=578093 RepID=A0A6A6NN35_9PEZI|nr:3-hydroxyisobutyrate dehydrogenase [Lineolata rhizophorae]
MTSPAKTVAFIGLGVMGYPMAVNLRTKMPADQTLLICDVSKDAIARFQAQMAGKGAVEVVGSGFDAVAKANMVITMLPDSSAVKKVYLDPSNGILAGAVAAAAQAAPHHKIIMECGTIETATILEVAKAAKETAATLAAGAGLEFVDAPVSGGPMGAENGSLTFMVGADSGPAFAAAREVLRTMGLRDSVFHCGPIGAGTAFKVINNYLSAITSLAAAEALNIGVKMGLDPGLLTDVINVSGGQCWVTSKSNPVPGVQPNVPSSRGYEGGFRIELCRKVLGMGSQLADMVGARTILDAPTLKAFDEAIADERYKGKDARVVYKFLNESERK